MSYRKRLPRVDQRRRYDAPRWRCVSIRSHLPWYRRFRLSSFSLDSLGPLPPHIVDALLPGSITLSLMAGEEPPGDLTIRVGRVERVEP